MYVAAYLLETLGYGLEVKQKEFEDFAVDVAQRAKASEDIALWFENHAHET